MVFDGQGRAVSEWVGTNDTPSSGWWAPTNAAGMTEVASYVFNNGGVGDGCPRKEQQWRRWIREWRVSRLTVREFCEWRGLSAANYDARRRRLDQRQAKADAFLSVRVVP